ncbi:MAG: ATP-binding cassette domain-containing protein [Oscillospiraceae bacterium]|nr:ATP-binding cassette domain-containing protein [Oscillospiraceae bacterium]MBQ3528966.1 ATP-binding cassette domain-containing protein [Oscillospiraceae bacterium]
MSEQLAIKIKGLKKQYRLGQIGGGTLTADLQSWWARVRHKEDPNSKIGTDQRLLGQRFWALNGIDLEIRQGEAIGIIGGNGAGKSTMLKILSRITAPTEGSVDIYGRIASMLEVGTGFSPEMTGRENIYMNGAILGMTKAEIDAKMEDIIDFSEVRDFIDTPVKRYSSGMYVKLAFSVAAHLDSEIMIMDEVLAVGDMAFQKKCLDKMRDAATVQGKTVLYVSHNMNTIRKLCDRCIVLDKGRIIFDGDVEEAISVYMGNDYSTLPVYHDFTAKERNYHFGQQVFINHFRFLDKQIAEYSAGEKLKYEICFDSKIVIEEARCILRIRDRNNALLIAGCLSEPFQVKIGKAQIKSFEVDIGCLVQDEYCLSIEIVSADQVGNYYAYDNPAAIMLIQVINRDQEKNVWEKRYWSNVRLPEARRL